MFVSYQFAEGVKEKRRRKGKAESVKQRDSSRERQGGAAEK